MSKAATGESLALAALVMFSISTVLTKVASGRLNLNAGFLISVSVNVAFATLVLLVQLALRQEALQWHAFGFSLFVISGVFSTYLGRWFFFESIARLGPAKASTFQVSSPLFTAVIAWLVLGERLSALAIGAMVLTLFGLLVISVTPAALARSGRGAQVAMRPSSSGVAATVGATTPFGVLLRSGLVLGVGSSAAYAVGNVLRGAALRSWNEAILGALLGALAALSLQLLFGTGTIKILRDLRSSDRTALFAYSAGGILSISAQMCVIASMAFIPIAVATLITLCSPVLVFPMSYFLLKNEEGIGARAILGCALTLAGIAVIVLF